MSLRRITLAIVVVCSAPGFCADPKADVKKAKLAKVPDKPAEEIPAEILAIFELGEKHRERLVKHYEGKVGDAKFKLSYTKMGMYAYSPKEGWINLGVSPETVNWRSLKVSHPDIFDKKASIAQAEKELTAATKALTSTTEKKNYLLPALEEFKVGEVGLAGISGKVLQVVNDRQAIVEVDGRTSWIEGMDFSGTVDDQEITLSGVVMEVKGTKRYTTVLGATKTVVHIMPHPKSDELFRIARTSKRAK